MKSSSALPLTGKDLLHLANEMESVPKKDLILAAGHTKPNGEPCHTSFYEALLDVKGILGIQDSPDSSECGDEECEDFFIDIPLRTSMRISVRRPRHFSQQEVLDSISIEELGECAPQIGWDCIKKSWHNFLESGEEPYDFRKSTPPTNYITECLRGF